MIFQAVKALHPNASFEVRNGVLVWKDSYIKKPTEEQIQAKIVELQAEYDSKQYQRDRATAYPSWQEQLDKIFHDGIDAWKADIQAIKDQFPKP
jgi:hypothetical protein